VEANSTGGQGSRRAVEPSDDDDDIQWRESTGSSFTKALKIYSIIRERFSETFRKFVSLVY
jgi:hypothetical protein